MFRQNQIELVPMNLLNPVYEVPIDRVQKNPINEQWLDNFQFQQINSNDQLLLREHTSTLISDQHNRNTGETEYAWPEWPAWPADEIQYNQFSNSIQNNLPRARRSWRTALGRSFPTNMCNLTHNINQYQLIDRTYHLVDDQKCSICLTSFIENEKLLATNCSHIYHPDCIKQWLERSDFCPLCKQKQIPIS